MSPSTRRRSGEAQKRTQQKGTRIHTHTPDSSPLTPDIPAQSPDSARSPRSTSSPKTPGLSYSPSPPPTVAFEIPDRPPQMTAAHDPIAPFRGLLSGLRLTPQEGTFLQAMLRLPHESQAREKIVHKSPSVLDDTWYIQERLENPSSNHKFNRMDSKWLQFQEQQSKSSPSSTVQTPSTIQPKTPSVLSEDGFDPILRIPGYSNAKLDDKWFQYDDPWFVYEEDEEEQGAPAKKRRLDPKPTRADPEKELDPPPGWEEFVHLEQAWEIWNNV